jgi:hypothetical protein
VQLWRTASKAEVAALPVIPPKEDIGPRFVPAPPGAPEGLYEEVDDGFGKVIRGPLRLWDIPADREGAPIVVEAVAPASADQAAQALIDARLMLRPYPRKGVPAVIAVRVATDARVGLMLYDGEVHALVEPTVHFSASAPDERAWARLGERRVVYLGPAPVPEVTTEDEVPAEPAPDPDLAPRVATRPARPRRRPV